MLFAVGWLAASALGCGEDSSKEDELGSEEDSSGGEAGSTTVAEGPAREESTSSPDPQTPTPVDVHGQLSVSGTRIVDASGVAVQLKGPSSMWLNWENTGFASNAQGVAFMRDDWGATVIRAAMGIEPGNAYLAQPEASLESVRAVIDNAIALGLYVIIDWHDHNAHEHQDEAIAFFRQMAQEYGDTPNVLYEVFNEPLQVSWRTVLKPYHEAVVAAIREHDPDGIIILGTPNWSQFVDEAAVDPLEGENLMYTLHFYACTHGERERTRGQRALNSGVAVFVTEWGATHADGGTPDNPELCLEDAQIWHDWMNENQISWAAWKFDDCQDMSCFFLPRTSPDGAWTDEVLHGHGAFVRDRMKE